MAQYIPKDALVAEIERIKNTEYNKNSISDDVACCALDMVIDAINTLEMKEVDYKPIDKDFERDAVQFCFDNSLNTTPRIARTLAKHFFELGLKAQKGE